MRNSNKLKVMFFHNVVSVRKVINLLIDIVFPFVVMSLIYGIIDVLHVRKVTNQKVKDVKLSTVWINKEIDVLVVVLVMKLVMMVYVQLVIVWRVVMRSVKSVSMGSLPLERYVWPLIVMSMLMMVSVRCAWRGLMCRMMALVIDRSVLTILPLSV